MKVYIAGPMTGYPDHNFPAHLEVAKLWREKGHIVFSPAEQQGGDTTLPPNVYTRNDVHMILQVDAIALLPGWEQSAGSKIEVLLGTWLGLMFFDAVTFEAIAPRVITSVPAVVRQAA